MDKTDMIDILLGFTGTAEQLVSSLEGSMQETLRSLKAVIKESHELIEEFAEEIVENKEESCAKNVMQKTP